MATAHTNSSDPVVIVGYARTPFGNFMGELQSLSAPELGAAAIAGALERGAISPQLVDEVIMGCVLPAAQGQAPARQAAVRAGLDFSVAATTINKMCGSGMKAIMMAADQLRQGGADCIVAGGMESMSHAPYLLPRQGRKMGSRVLLDHLLYDGLEDSFGEGKVMGVYAERCVSRYQFTREEQDRFATTSLQRAREATEKGHLTREIIPIATKGKRPQTIASDELPRLAKLEAIPQLSPAFDPEGTITPASSSALSDGAAAVVLTRLSIAQREGLEPLARLVGQATHAQEPDWFTTAPIESIRKVLGQVGWQSEEVDLYEINEAFAAVTMAAMRDLALPPEKVNVFGGACALGHPVGATGARLVGTLVNALHSRKAQRGVASLCIGGGEATAVAMEL